MEPKSNKKCLKCDAPKKHVFEHDFDRFFIASASRNEAKIDRFLDPFRKRRFCKNRAPVEAKFLFLRFRASKFRPKIDA